MTLAQSHSSNAHGNGAPRGHQRERTGDRPQRCHLTHCSRTARGFLCDEHWALLPRWVKDQILETWRLYTAIRREGASADRTKADAIRRKMRTCNNFARALCYLHDGKIQSWYGAIRMAADDTRTSAEPAPPQPHGGDA